MSDQSHKSNVLPFSPTTTVTPSKRSLVFEGKPLVSINYRGKFWWLGRQVGAAMEYAQGGSRFVNLINQEWSDEFDDQDRWLVQGDELRIIKEIIGQELGTQHVPSLLLLSESGINKAALLSRKPEGRRLRNWLAKEVMPEIARTGQYASEAIHTRPVVPVDNFGRIEEWMEMRRRQEVTGQALMLLKDDAAHIKTEQDRQREKLEILEARVCRGQPTEEERKAQVDAIKLACDCRVSDRERLMLLHVASEGPATSYRRIGAAAMVSCQVARTACNGMSDRSILDFEQRDPNMPDLRNYFVLPQGLEGHAENCPHEKAFAAASLNRLLDLTSSETPLEVVTNNPPPAPPPPRPVPQPAPAPALALQEVEELSPGAVLSEREKFLQHLRTYGKLHDYTPEDFHRATSRVYACLAVQHGIECRGKRNWKTNKKTKPIDWLETHGKCDVALEVAQNLYPLPAVDRPSDNLSRRVH